MLEIPGCRPTACHWDTPRSDGASASALAARVRLNPEDAVACAVGAVGGRARQAEDRAPGRLLLRRAHGQRGGGTAQRHDGGGRRHRPPHSPWHGSLMAYSHGRQSTPSSAPEVNTPGGLLTIGAEPGKGNAVTRRAHELLAAEPQGGALPPSVAGNIEGGALMAGAAGASLAGPHPPEAAA